MKDYSEDEVAAYAEKALKTDDLVDNVIVRDRQAGYWMWRDVAGTRVAVMAYVGWLLRKDEDIWTLETVHENAAYALATLVRSNR